VPCTRLFCYYKILLVSHYSIFKFDCSSFIEIIINITYSSRTYYFVFVNIITINRRNADLFVFIIISRYSNYLFVFNSLCNSSRKDKHIFIMEDFFSVDSPTPADYLSAHRLPARIYLKHTFQVPTVQSKLRNVRFFFFLSFNCDFPG